jgi:hypothetical protein
MTNSIERQREKCHLSMKLQQQGQGQFMSVLTAMAVKQLKIIEIIGTLDLRISN